MPDHDSQQHPGDHVPWMAADAARDFNSRQAAVARAAAAQASGLRRPGTPGLRVPPLASRSDRRTFLKQGLLAGGLLAGAGVAISELAGGNGGHLAPTQTNVVPTGPAPLAPKPSAAAPADPPVTRTVAAPPQSYRQPNILVILVDQLRTPTWFPAAPVLAGLLPNITSLSDGAVSFQNHFTASNDCTPSRSALLTGLYTHQTGCLITGGSTLDPGFPTWGSMLRDHGYNTYYYGKWHLTHADGHWNKRNGPRAMERYGFSGGTFPSPDGGPGQGWKVDPHIARQFEEWFADEGGQEPWCTTVSFVNPHDIAWWYVWTDRVAAESSAPSMFHALPPNFETPEQLMARKKPTLQLSLQTTAAASFGQIQFTGPDVVDEWMPFLDLYLKLQRNVDYHIGRVLRALASNPAVAANTVVVLASDHGEYGASHGLRGKGAGAYDEATRVPLIVKDLRGGLITHDPQLGRNQLTSSVDVAPMLLTIGTGSNEWRGDPTYAHLSNRLDLTRILTDPGAPGRPYILHATDEVVTEYAVEPFAANAPLHVTALRTPQAKYATYSFWHAGGMTIDSKGQQTELYDYSTPAGRLEIDNVAGSSPLEEPMRAMLENAIATELQEPLYGPLAAARRRGVHNFENVAARAADTASLRRIRRAATAISI